LDTFVADGDYSAAVADRFHAPRDLLENEVEV